MQTFGWEFDRAARFWARQLKSSTGTTLLRTLHELLVLLDLEPSVFDRAAAERLPVRGSSTYRGGGERVHWTAVEKTSAFDPVERWRTWKLVSIVASPGWRAAAPLFGLFPVSVRGRAGRAHGRAGAARPGVAWARKRSPPRDWRPATCCPAQRIVGQHRHSR